MNEMFRTTVDAIVAIGPNWIFWILLGVLIAMLLPTRRKH